MQKLCRNNKASDFQSDNNALVFNYSLMCKVRRTECTDAGR